MDACLHVMMHKDISRQEYRDIMYIPSRLEHFIFYRREYGAGNWFSHIRLNQWTPGEIILFVGHHRFLVRLW
jgi:hypothetical protein